MSDASRRPHDAEDVDEESPTKARRSARSSIEGTADPSAHSSFNFDSALARGDDDYLDDNDSMMDDESASLYHQVMAQAECDVRSYGSANTKGDGRTA